MTALDRLIDATLDEGPVPREEQLDLVLDVLAGRARIDERLCRTCLTELDDLNYCGVCGLAAVPDGAQAPPKPCPTHNERASAQALTGADADAQTGEM